ncbi:MAG: dihydropteroate synthase [Coprothermobacterota bacterium]|nr:dihydropteroate synthase [Coprothermobacterota bacterium]
MLPPVCRVLRSRGELEDALREIQASPASWPIMAAKGHFLAVQICDLDPRAANILKQEMLARGGEAAISWEVLSLHNQPTDALLMGTQAQLTQLAEKLRQQPFGLAVLAARLDRLVGSCGGMSMACGSASFNSIFRGHPFPWGERTFLVGILNLTPDSFSGDGLGGRVDEALAKAEAMVKEGADILDVGGESSRPGHLPVEAEEEWGRVRDFLSEFLPHAAVPVSLDTCKEEVARRGLELGVNLINDIWGLRRGRGIAKLAAAHGAGLILQHNRRVADYRRFLPEVMADLEESLSWALEDGVPRERLIVDPGFGFGKSASQNYILLRELRAFRGLGQPLLVGVSRKSFLGLTNNRPPAQRTFATAAAVALAVEGGADLVRVHEVQDMREVVQVCDRTLRGERILSLS